MVDTMKGSSRFLEGMTERKARAEAEATATANSGILLLRQAHGQDDGEKQTTVTVAECVGGSAGEVELGYF